ncbi:MAG: hypothetical protein LBQ47_08820 [Endomicrobium sp.]|jgi:hypothetical protein|nr:hypothetical protein [Endomicrobium sp.]
MKKFFRAFSVFVFICAASAVNAEMNIVPKVAIDIPASLSYDSAADQDAKRGFNLSLEVRGDISQYFMWGAGSAYLFNRGIAGCGSDSDFSFMSVYGSLFFTPFGYFYQVKPYIRVNAGYDIIASNNAADKTKGGVTWGGGVGVEYKDVVGEVYGAHHYGSVENPDPIDFKYVQIGIALGYKFKLKS